MYSNKYLIEFGRFRVPNLRSIENYYKGNEIYNNKSILFDKLVKKVYEI